MFVNPSLLISKRIFFCLFNSNMENVVVCKMFIEFIVRADSGFL